MMKRILVVTLLSFIFNIHSYSQCVPDTSIHNVGVYPDSATGLASGTVGVAYDQVIQLKVPVDTVVFIFGVPITITIDSVHLAAFNGLPPGLTYTCSAPNCTFLGGSNGCADILGIPTAAGHYPLTAITNTYASGFTQTDTINYYSIDIAAASGLATFNSNNFAVNQNTPNPFSDYSIISYNIPHKGMAEFSLFNLIGKEVYHISEMANAGGNSISLDARNFAPGVYMYSLQFENQTITKRMVISKK